VQWSLNLMKHASAPLSVALLRLLPEQVVDVRVISLHML